MKRTYLFLYFVLVWNNILSGQISVDFEHYKPLLCSGEIPDDFKTAVLSYVDQAKASKSVSRKDKKQEVKFAEYSNFQLNNILYSGKVLYGDPLSEYVSKVADAALTKDKELRSKLRFYILKSTAPNAYSTQRGIVFISMGMLSQIETESQLAFIICHEAVHFKNNHNLQTYKHNQNLRVSSEDKLLSNMMEYSKDNELEADREGLKLFLASPYGTGDISSLFDVLLYSYLPFDEIPFDTAYFNTNPKYKIPGKYFPDQVSDITAEEDVSDSLSTHPNIKKRRSAIFKLLETKGKQDGVAFYVSKDEFETVRHMARCELAIIHLQETETEDALYTAYLLEKHYGKSYFIETVKSAALYITALQKSNSEDKFKESKPVRMGKRDEEPSSIYYKNIEGQSQSIYYLTYNMPAKELLILAAQYNYFNYIKFSDEFFSVRFKGLISELVNDYELNSDYFYNSLPVVDTILLSETSVDSLNESKSKVDKIKKFKSHRNEKKKISEENYFRYAFVDHAEDSLIVNSISYFSEQKRINDERDEDSRYQKYESEKERIIARNGEALDIHKLIMINPYYSAYKTTYTYGNYIIYAVKTRNPDVTPLQEIEVEEQLTKYVTGYARKLKMDITVMGNTQMENINTDAFNQYQQLMNWFNERLSIGTFGAHTFNDRYISDYANEYGYMGVCFVTNINKRLELVFVLFNLKTGGSEMLYEKNLKKGKATGIYTRMMLYDALHQVSQKPKRLEKLKRKFGY